jgi:hypothetical protein
VCRLFQNLIGNTEFVFGGKKAPARPRRPTRATGPAINLIVPLPPPPCTVADQNPRGASGATHMGQGRLAAVLLGDGLNMVEVDDHCGSVLVAVVVMGFASELHGAAMSGNAPHHVERCALDLGS